MIKIEPKYAYGRKVYIKKGFYRGYTAIIRKFDKVTVHNTDKDEDETNIMYEVAVENTPMKAYMVREDWIIPYRKWGLF
jgi:pectin methylesterase-like acyl-CoA thioesterase